MEAVSVTMIAKNDKMDIKTSYPLLKTSIFPLLLGFLC